MKHFIVVILLMCCFSAFGQETARIRNIQNQLELLATDYPELNENLKLEINVSNVTLSNFLIAVSKVHQLNMSIAPEVGNTTIVNNFSNVTVADLLVFLCKQYALDIDFTGNILAIKKYQAPPAEVLEKEIQVGYNTLNDQLSLDLKNDSLEAAFRKIMEVSGKNLLYANGMASMPLTLFISGVPFDVALEKLAAVNGMTYTKSRDGFYLFNSINDADPASGQLRRSLGSRGLNYEVLDTVNKLLRVDFKNTPIVSIITSMGEDLHLDVYTASPLEQAGNVTFNAKHIVFDDLLELMFESSEKGTKAGEQPTAGGHNQAFRQNAQQPNQGFSTHYSYKRENNIYFFGTADQLSVRHVEVIQMMHRSVELLGDPSQRPSQGRTAGRTNTGGINYFGNNGTNGNIAGGQDNSSGFGGARNVNTRGSNFDNYDIGAEALVNILPDELKNELDIRVDFELNSFLVSGPSSKIARFRKFIEEIDKPVPVVLIEVMIIEVKRSSTVETGISWGIGEAPVETRGKLFPSTDLTLGAKTVNKIIGGFDGFGSYNIGQVVPEFFATIKAMEANGNLKIRSTPKLSTLNGHRASLSIGETTYYVITNQSFFGSQIPTSSEIRNFAPIDAELAVSIKPLVSGNGQVTLDINVVQSDFSGERIEEDAPPGLTSREFSSIIRMQDQDLAILGGLEEKVKNDTGTGVPLLARIPVIKWLFSQRKREDSKQKLTILIKPTVIY
ncbi:hypothetical protein U1E44_08270 [Arenibacter sp. GZD96]|uniref:type II secretion system protein GspD n=1 Tax=Aurantibrevibacter litoralis TaxID=3106030 RepID=UPI002B003213|nr:hypothetical protein [Arenibacter sp. GZD-96]MEA1786082.1 hypothetical protein [Arenibacter sp. GZD-96]